MKQEYIPVTPEQLALFLANLSLEFDTPVHELESALRRILAEARVEPGEPE